MITWALAAAGTALTAGAPGPPAAGVTPAEMWLAGPDGRPSPHDQDPGGRFKSLRRFSESSAHVIQLDQAAGIALRKRPSMKLHTGAGHGPGTSSASWGVP